MYSIKERPVRYKIVISGQKYTELLTITAEVFAVHGFTVFNVAKVLDKPYSQLIPLSGVAVYGPAIQHRLEPCPCTVHPVHPMLPGGPVWLLR